MPRDGHEFIVGNAASGIINDATSSSLSFMWCIENILRLTAWLITIYSFAEDTLRASFLKRRRFAHRTRYSITGFVPSSPAIIMTSLQACLPLMPMSARSSTRFIPCHILLSILAIRNDDGDWLYRRVLGRIVALGCVLRSKPRMSGKSAALRYRELHLSFFDARDFPARFRAEDIFRSLRFRGTARFAGGSPMAHILIAHLPPALYAQYLARHDGQLSIWHPRFSIATRSIKRFSRYERFHEKWKITGLLSLHMAISWCESNVCESLREGPAALLDTSGGARALSAGSDLKAEYSSPRDDFAMPGAIGSAPTREIADFAVYVWFSMEWSGPARMRYRSRRIAEHQAQAARQPADSGPKVSAMSGADAWPPWFRGEGNAHRRRSSMISAGSPIVISGWFLRYFLEHYDACCLLSSSGGDGMLPRSWLCWTMILICVVMHTFLLRVSGMVSIISCIEWKYFSWEIFDDAISSWGIVSGLLYFCSISRHWQTLIDFFS